MPKQLKDKIIEYKKPKLIVFDADAGIGACSSGNGDGDTCSQGPAAGSCDTLGNTAEMCLANGTSAEMFCSTGTGGDDP